MSTIYCTHGIMIDALTSIHDPQWCLKGCCDSTYETSMHVYSYIVYAYAACIASDNQDDILPCSSLLWQENCHANVPAVRVGMHV